MTTPTQRPSAQAVFDRAFHPFRDPRSEAYRAGVLAALRYRLEGARIACPYAAGSAEYDAFHAGLKEGHARGRAALATDEDNHNEPATAGQEVLQ